MTAQRVALATVVVHQSRVRLILRRRGIGHHSARPFAASCVLCKTSKLVWLGIEYRKHNEASSDEANSDCVLYTQDNDMVRWGRPTCHPRCGRCGAYGDVPQIPRQWRRGGRGAVPPAGPVVLRPQRRPPQAPACANSGKADSVRSKYESGSECRTLC